MSSKALLLFLCPCVDTFLLTFKKFFSPILCHISFSFFFLCEVATEWIDLDIHSYYSQLINSYSVEASELSIENITILFFLSIQSSFSLDYANPCVCIKGIINLLGNFISIKCQPSILFSQIILLISLRCASNIFLALICSCTHVAPQAAEKFNQLMKWRRITQLQITLCLEVY